jgi:hypothetical protein
MMGDFDLLILNLCCYSWLAEYDPHPSYAERSMP